MTDGAIPEIRRWTAEHAAPADVTLWAPDGLPEFRPGDDLARILAEALIAGPSALVSMGGYNTVCEVLAAGKSMLVVPRVRPRKEQLVRAEALSQRGALEMCHPDRLDRAALNTWFDTLNGPPVPANPIDLGGMGRIPGLAARLLDRTEVPHSA